ncbi:YghA protein [Luminiphilus syltensis NOR5-1B]|uniref:YghA protein n=1 Tax=Luminiphilus syltensis NOR5-1B TaxID=565045 RepID=B8KY39_9GAMM|nr:trimeric intracellular cation channel family protein [Luminiphilus syltensis]EED34894.1 YghA protein [Luminiphilus syltensis NOR5-1B]
MGGVITGVDLLATAVFAVSGALAAAEERNDILGFILFGTITGIGGGTLRDLLLGADSVFWLYQNEYLWVCLGASLATWFLAPQFNSLQKLLLWADAVGMALFSVLGAVKAIQLGAPAVVAIGMGVMSATFGSLIRDTFLNRTPVLLAPEIYVTAAMVGAVSYTLLAFFEVVEAIALPLAILFGFGLRACAIIFDLRLPKYGDGR